MIRISSSINRNPSWKIPQTQTQHTCIRPQTPGRGKTRGQLLHPSELDDQNWAWEQVPAGDADVFMAHRTSVSAWQPGCVSCLYISMYLQPNLTLSHQLVGRFRADASDCRPAVSTFRSVGSLSSAGAQVPSISRKLSDGLQEEEKPVVNSH